MENCSKIREMIIDNFYGEGKNAQIESHLEVCPECREFARELGAVMENMDGLKSDVPVSNYDITCILDKAEGIQGGRRRKIETAMFVSAALLILAAFGFLTIKLGSQFILISQAIISACLPLVLLAAMKMRDIKEETR